MVCSKIATKITVAGARGPAAFVAIALAFSAFSPAASLAGTVTEISGVALLTPGEATVDDAKELARIGDLYASGQTVPQDMDTAIEYYRRAAELGDPTGTLRLGELNVFGRGIAQNIPEGIALIDKVASTGNTSALILLADVYSRGIAGREARAKAIEVYEQAAALGRTLALVKLGDIYRDGRIVSADFEKAAEYYRKAADAGRPNALVSLGKGMATGKLGNIGTPAEGISILKEAESLGVPEAVVALSDCYLFGYGVKQDAAMALSLLKEAADNGNVAAGRQLVSIYRDGRNKQIKRDLKLAQSYFAKVKDQLDPSIANVETLLFEASTASSASALRSIDEYLSKVQSSQRPPVIRRLRSINPNAYIYLVQARFEQLGLYNGKPNGQLSAATARAIMKYCGEREPKEICGRGPMTGPVAEVLANAF